MDYLAAEKLGVFGSGFLGRSGRLFVHSSATNDLCVAYASWSVPMTLLYCAFQFLDDECDFVHSIDHTHTHTLVLSSTHDTQSSSVISVIFRLPFRHVLTLWHWYSNIMYRISDYNIVIFWLWLVSLILHTNLSRIFIYLIPDSPYKPVSNAVAGSRELVDNPDQHGMSTYETVTLTTSDGLKLHAFHIPAPSSSDVTLLFCHVRSILLINLSFPRFTSP
jgi:hypothetical protein